MGLKEKIFLCAISVFFVLSLLSCSSEQKVAQEHVLFLGKVRVKNYPDTPFIYSNWLKIEDSLAKDQKTKLTENLANYWADSLFAPREQKWVFFYRIKKPPVLDTSNITVTEQLMKGYLFTQGFFNAGVNIFVKGIDTFNKRNFIPQQRAFVSANIHTGKQTVIDSLEYTLKDSGLAALASKYAAESFIKPKTTYYTKQLVAAELDRLVNIYRNNGYFMLNRANLIAEVDTADASLLKLTLDPFEQAELIERAAERKNKNPSCIVNITQRRFIDTSLAKSDSSFLRKFHVGKVNYFPETSITELTPDSIFAHKDEIKKTFGYDFTVYGMNKLFSPTIFKDYTYIKPDSLYSDENYYKTLNNLNLIGAWRQVETKYFIHDDSLIDISFFLYPEKRFNWNANIEMSRNSGDFLSSSNLIGISLNGGYKDRNLFKRAILLSANLNVGEEFSFEQNNSILQAFQVSPGLTLTFPRLINYRQPFKFLNVLRPVKFDFGRNLIGLNFSYAQRTQFFIIRSWVANYGWEWKYKNYVSQIKLPNVEIYSLSKLPLLIDAIKTNPFLQTSFLNGSVVSVQGNRVCNFVPKKNSKNSIYIRVSSEIAPLGAVKALQNNFYAYIKGEVEFKYLVKMSKTDAVFRLFYGSGYSFGNSARLGRTLPFFKQYIAGGPNSMRAWGLRLLGQGSSLVSDTSSTFRDRYGDMQLEGNFEWRYLLAHFSAVDIKGALFADAGNIWNIHKDTANPNGDFDMKRLWNDMAIGVGTGLRFDFSYFLIRLDFGIKLKDPARSINDLDFIKNFTWLNKDYIKYDGDGNLISPRRTNYAVQLGIGLPF